MNDVIQQRLLKLRRAGAITGLAGLLLCGVGLAFNARQFFVSYLVAFVFWGGLSLGCLAVAMIHHLTGGRWGFVTRRFLEAGFMTLPWVAVLIVPLLFGMHELYPWARPEAVAASETLKQKVVYLNAPWFCARAVFYFAVWSLIAVCLRGWSLQQDATQDPKPTRRLRALSGPGLVVYALTATFAFVDWVMSVEPRWYSTIFVVIVLIGEILAAFCLSTLMLAWFSETPPFQPVVERKHFHHLGNLLLAFVVFWTYVSFSQFLIVYSGNLPREIDWYLHRIAGGWKWVVVVLALFHFLIPFFLLLFRMMKQAVARLALIAVMIFLAHIVEVCWLIEPSFFSDGFHVHWLDFAAVIGVGGIWVTAFATNLKRHALLPVNDPRIEYSTPQIAHAK